MKSLIVMLKRQFIWALFLLPVAAAGQSPLDRYIQEGLTNNIALQQKALSLQQAETALAIARGYFFPSIQLIADYTSGDGGRSIALPVGDLLNPVYRSLNQLTQSDAFPEIQNVEQNFFPKDFYDARVRTSLPIVNADLIINRSIKSKELLMADSDVRRYKRQLTFDITEAYYKHLAAGEAVKIFEGAMGIVEKNVQINESLRRNGKGLPAQVLRSKSELERVRAELNSARNSFSNSRKYFNFLLNRELDAPIDLPTEVGEPVQSASLEIETAGREELAMAKIGTEISHSVVRMNQLKRLPKVSAFLDLGSQASGWQFNDQSQYYLLGVQFSLPLFQGFTNQLSIRQSKMNEQKAALALRDASQAVALSANLALSELLNAKSNYTASQEQLKSATGYFSLIERGYAEGINTLIEFLDARNQLTTSELLNNVRRFELFIANAKLTRETASAHLN
ncbi:MAG TPA: TolC family protein [Chryseosolibacter sp.]